MNVLKSTRRKYNSGQIQKGVTYLAEFGRKIEAHIP